MVPFPLQSLVWGWLQAWLETFCRNCIWCPYSNECICQLLYHGISILTCPNMLCAMSVDSACVCLFWKWRQQRGLKAVLVCVISALLVKMNMSRKSCIMLFHIARIIGFVCWGRNIHSFHLHHFLRTSQRSDLVCCIKSTSNFFLTSLLLSR
jgi:hypothetical protein